MSSQAIARLLLAKNAVKISTNPPFTWASGIRSPIYCDNRVLISFPEAREQIVNGFKNLIAKNQLEFDVVAGTATAGIPWAAFVAHELKKPMVYIRPKPKDHGAGKQVEGTMERGARVLIIEDLISTGGSSLGSAEACQKEYAAKIVGMLAIFTYELEKARLAFEVARVPLFTLSNFSTLVGELKNSDAEKNLILDFARDPAGWWERFQKIRNT